MSRWRESIGLVAVLLVLVPARPAAGQAGLLTGRMVAQDPRLSKPITVASPRIYLGQLLDELSGQTSVAVNTDDEGSASGMLLTVGLRGIPLIDALNAIWSAVSISGADWGWSRSGAPGYWSYSLFEPATVKDSAARWRLFAKQAAARLVSTMDRLSAMTADERERHQQELSAALCERGGKMVEAQLKYQGVWDMVRLFAETVSPEDQARVLSGVLRANVTLDSLSPDVRREVQALWVALDPHGLKNGVPEARPEPRNIVYFGQPGGGPAGGISTTVYMDLGPGTA